MAGIFLSGADGLLLPELSREIFEGAVAQSACMRLARRLPDMTTAQLQMPVLAGLPTVAWVAGARSGDDPSPGLLATTAMAWKGKYIVAEEIGGIIPIPKALLLDVTYDIWGQTRPRLSEAMGALVDNTMLFGTTAPASFPTAVVPAAVAAGNYATLSGDADPGDLYDDMFSPGGVWEKTETDGYAVTGTAASPTMKAKLRGLRTSTGEPIFLPNMQEKGNFVLDGFDCFFPANGAWDDTAALMVAGQWDQLVYAIRMDMELSMLTEATLQDPSTGAILYNLAQQNMVAMKLIMRMGWQMPNPINRMNPDEGTRYPFGALVPVAA
jgi:HK97 family phage major capsid protein